MHYYYHFYWGWGWIFWLVAIILVIWILAEIFGGEHHASGPAQRPVHDNALQALNERYAKGEITKEEYQQKKADILG